MFHRCWCTVGQSRYHDTVNPKLARAYKNRRQEIRASSLTLCSESKMVKDKADSWHHYWLPRLPGAWWNPRWGTSLGSFWIPRSFKKSDDVVGPCQLLTKEAPRTWEKHFKDKVPDKHRVFASEVGLTGGFGGCS